jgi:hypothetical protein
MKHTSGRRAFCTRVEAKGETHGGAYRSENASTSNRKQGKNPCRRKIKVSFAMVISEGLAGPKPIPNGGGDGHTVNIPWRCYVRWRDEGLYLWRLIGLSSGQRGRGVGKSALLSLMRFRAASCRYSQEWLNIGSALPRKSSKVMHNSTVPQTDTGDQVE